MGFSYPDAALKEIYILTRTVLTSQNSFNQVTALLGVPKPTESKRQQISSFLNLYMFPWFCEMKVFPFNGYLYTSTQSISQHLDAHRLFARDGRL